MACYCAHVHRIPTRTRVVVLQHPREHGNAIGTARMAELCLPESEVLVGVDFSGNARLDALLSDAERPAVVLYPGPGARNVETDPPPGAVTLVVIDGTWNQARSLVRKNPRLRQLPRYAFTPPRPSEYQIRREPQADYVSTIEALAFTLAALERDGRNFEELLAPFRAMVAVQLGFAARSTHGRHRERRRKLSRAPARLPELLLDPRLVCVGGEANAWPHDRALRRPPYPHELVHWLAQRLSDHPAGAGGFEALIAPRAPLSKSPLQHARIETERLDSGLSLDAFRSAWHDFLREDDVICSWGHYASALLLRDQGRLTDRVLDLRKVAGDYLKCRPGSLEALIEAQGLSFMPRGVGRGGERLGMLVAVTEWLASEARRERVPLASEASEAEADLAVHE